MIQFFKKYSYVILSLFLLISFGFFINNEVVAKKYLTSSLVQQSQGIISNSFDKSNLTDLNIEIPEHINLTNFYKTYGERMLGNKDINPHTKQEQNAEGVNLSEAGSGYGVGVKIISREEWGADNQYADPQFIENFCQKNYCYENRYNPEDTFSEKEYWKSIELLINYNKNFKLYDNFFLQSLNKENGFVYYYLPVEEIIVHHTAGKFTTDFEESKKELQRIYLMTAVQRQWRDIGYHYLIDGAGRIYEGSLGGKYSVGIHAYEHNKGTVSISFMGDFRPDHDKLNEKMQKSFINLVEYLISQYELDVSQKEFYLRKPDLSGREINESIIRGHMELDIREKKTECPGVDPEYLRELIYSSLKTSASY